MSKSVRLLSAAAVVSLMASSAYAQNMGYRYNGPWESPEQNNIRSAQYDHLLQVNRGFRHYRMRKECGPINFVMSLRQDCFASFDQYEPLIPRRAQGQSVSTRSTRRWPR
jgi:hypothetical protein